MIRTLSEFAFDALSDKIMALLLPLLGLLFSLGDGFFAFWVLGLPFQNSYSAASKSVRRRLNFVANRNTGNRMRSLRYKYRPKHDLRLLLLFFLFGAGFILATA